MTPPGRGIRNGEEAQRKQDNRQQDQAVFAEFVHQIAAVQAGKDAEGQADAQDHAHALRQQMEMLGEVDGDERQRHAAADGQHQ